MKLGRVWCVVAVLLVVVTGVAAPAAAAMDSDRLIKYYRSKASLPPTQKIVVTDVKRSALNPKLEEGTLEIGEEPGLRKTSFVASEDGRYVVFGDVEDISLDPMKATMSKIDLGGFPAKGGDRAKVTIVEYSDFQCP